MLRSSLPHQVLWVLFGLGVLFGLDVQLFSCSVVSDSVTPQTAIRQATLSFTVFQSLLKLMPIESMSLWSSGPDLAQQGSILIDQSSGSDMKTYYMECLIAPTVLTRVPMQTEHFPPQRLYHSWHRLWVQGQNLCAHAKS